MGFCEFATSILNQSSAPIPISLIIQEHDLAPFFFQHLPLDAIVSIRLRGWQGDPIHFDQIPILPGLRKFRLCGYRMIVPEVPLYAFLNTHPLLESLRFEPFTHPWTSQVDSNTEPLVKLPNLQSMKAPVHQLRRILAHITPAERTIKRITLTSKEHFFFKIKDELEGLFDLMSTSRTLRLVCEVPVRHVLATRHFASAELAKAGMFFNQHITHFSVEYYPLVDVSSFPLSFVILCT